MVISVWHFLHDNPEWLLWIASQASGWLRLYVAHRLKKAEQRRPSSGKEEQD